MKIVARQNVITVITWSSGAGTTASNEIGSTAEPEAGHDIAGRKEKAMRVLISTIAAVLVTVSQVMASGGGNAEPVSFLMILFMGFGALILVFQLFPAVVLFIGMIKGIMAPAVKKEDAAAADGNKS